MKTIDFDNEFRLYIEQWIMNNSDQYSSHDDMEIGIVDVYAKWLSTPADFIDGDCPIDYFSQYNNADELVDMMVKYKTKGITVPDLLLDKISQMGELSRDSLRGLLSSQLELPKSDSSEIKMLCVNLLSEIDDSQLHIDYVDMLADESLDGDLATLLIEKLEYSDQSIVDSIVKNLQNTNSEVVRERYADVVVNYRSDDRVYTFLAEMFNNTSKHTSLYAAYLGKYDDPRAIDILTEALDWPDINYIDYIEIAAALERLGEEITHKRDFDGDQYYESLKHIE